MYYMVRYMNMKCKECNGRVMEFDSKDDWDWGRNSVDRYDVKKFGFCEDCNLIHYKMKDGRIVKGEYKNR